MRICSIGHQLVLFWESSSIKARLFFAITLLSYSNYMTWLWRNFWISMRFWLDSEFNWLMRISFCRQQQRFASLSQLFSYSNRLHGIANLTPLSHKLIAERLHHNAVLSPFWCTNVALNMSGNCVWPQTRCLFRSNHFKSDETPHSFHTVTINLVMPRSPPTPLIYVFFTNSKKEACQYNIFILFMRRFCIKVWAIGYIVYFFSYFNRLKVSDWIWIPCFTKEKVKEKINNNQRSSLKNKQKNKSFVSRAIKPFNVCTVQSRFCSHSAEREKNNKTHFYSQRASCQALIANLYKPILLPALFTPALTTQWN